MFDALKKINRLSIYFIFLFFFLLPMLAAAQSYIPLASIQGFIPASIGNDLTGYLNGLFKLGIAVATGLAVIMVIIGGIQYMSTDAVGDKTEGREKIISALWGLLLALASWMILNTINPQLVTGRLTIAPVNSTTTPIPSNIGGPLGLDPNGFLPPEPGRAFNGSAPNISGMGGPNGFFGSGPSQSQGVAFDDPSLYTSYNGSAIRDFYQDDNGNMVFDYQNGSQVIQYWDDESPTGGGEYYNPEGYRMINGQTVSYVDYTSVGSNGVSNPIYHFDNGNYFIQYVDTDYSPVGGGELYNTENQRIINGQASDYQYYDANGKIVVHWVDGRADSVLDPATALAITNSPFGPPVGNQASGPAAQRLLQAAKEAANPHSCNYLAFGDSVGCARAASTIIDNATLGEHFFTRSTQTLNDELAHSSVFSYEGSNYHDALPGDVIVWPGIGDCEHGGVCGHAVLCSSNGCETVIDNSSALGHVVERHSDLDYFSNTRGLTAHVYRPTGG